MKPPSEPKINKSNPKRWFIYWNHDVPFSLWKFYPRRRIRIKETDGINDYEGEEREKYAEFRRTVWKYMLEKENYNPFLPELKNINKLTVRKLEAKKEIVEVKESIKENPRFQTQISDALDAFLVYQKGHNKNSNTNTTWRSTVKWLKAYFNKNYPDGIQAQTVKRLDITTALEDKAIEKDWEPLTYNNNLNLCQIIFNWLATEEYIPVNPAKASIKRRKTGEELPVWYDKELAIKVKEELKKDGFEPALRACQFTYHICIRSQQELLKFKAGDIDRNLKRIHFRANLTKNSKECYRDYSDDFEGVLQEMNFESIPKHYYVFGKGGVPSEVQAAKNTLSNIYRPIKIKLGLSDKYSIYKWKHTRVCHEMMKKTDPYEIMDLCRHSDISETLAYMRSFQLSLRKTYNNKELIF